MPRDVFIQAFYDGSPIAIRADAVRAVIEPFVVERAEGVASIQTHDGGADLWGYGDDGGLAVVGATGMEIWDLVVAIAQVTGAVIIPMGGAPLVVDALRIDDLPEESRAAAQLVTTGAELVLALQIGRDLR